MKFFNSTLAILFILFVNIISCFAQNSNIYIEGNLSLNKNGYLNFGNDSGWGVYNIHVYGTGKSAFHINKSFALRFSGNDVDSYGTDAIYETGNHKVDAIFIQL